MPHRTGNGGPTDTQQVVDFNEIRSQKMDEKRRKTERIFFQKLLSVYTVMGDSEMRPIELLEVSEEGCSFQVPFDATRPWPTTTDKDLTVRLYFSQDTYIPVNLKIINSRPCIDHGTRYIRYGCAIDQTLGSYPAFQQFVRFLGLYAEHAHRDVGGMSVFYI